MHTGSTTVPENSYELLPLAQGQEVGRTLRPVPRQAFFLAFSPAIDMSVLRKVSSRLCFARS